MLAFCQPVKVPVLTGGKKWIDVMWRDQGFFLRFRKAESGTLGWPKRSRGWDESVAGPGARLEREGYNKGLEQGVFREDMDSRRRMGCRGGEREMDLERRGRIDWGREEARVCGRSEGGSKCKAEMGFLGNTWELCL